MTKEKCWCGSTETITLVRCKGCYDRKVAELNSFIAMGNMLKRIADANIKKIKESVE